MGHGPFALPVPEHEIGIAAHGDAALARREAVDPGRIGRRQGHELMDIDAALADALGHQQRHAQLDPRHAQRHRGEGRLGPALDLLGIAMSGMVRGEDLEGPVLQPLPHQRLIGLLPRRRGADAFRPFHAMGLDVLGGEEEILRAGLAIDLEAPPLGPADLLRRGIVGDMGDQDRHAGELGEGDGPMGRLAVAGGGMGGQMIFDLGPAALQQAIRQPAHHPVVLGMDHDHGPLAQRQIQHLHHLVVVEGEAFIGEIDLEGGAAVADQRRQLLPQHLGRGIADHEMEGIVDQGLALGARMIVVDHGAERLAADRHGEGDHRGGAAAGRRPGAGTEIVAGLLPLPGLLVHMAMAVDPAGGDELARGIDHRLGVAEIITQGGDAAVLHGDVAVEEVAGGGDSGVADEEVELAVARHRGFPPQ